MIKNIKKSLEIIKTSKVPRELFGNPEFLKGNRIRQERAISIKDRIDLLISEHKTASAKKLITELFKTLIKLWGYRIHEKPLKLSSNFGLVKNKIIVIDFLEITDNIKTVKRQLETGKIGGLYELTNYLTLELRKHFNKEAKKYVNLKTLESSWGKRLK